MRYLYTILFYIATPFILLRLLMRSLRNPAYRHRWSERFGQVTPLKNPKVIWLHAVSLGESIAAAPLVNALLEQLPNYTLVVTTTTPTGSAQIQKTFSNKVYHVYLPYDLPHVITRFLKRIRPKQVIFMETELWPNLLNKLQRHNIPTLVANARLSEQSLINYQRVIRLFKPLLSHLIVCAQSEADAKRFKHMGAKTENTFVTGNIKFDNPVSEKLIQQGQELQALWKTRPTLIAASTHEGEEVITLNAFKKIREQYPATLLILVPRHPERFDKVADLCVKSGYKIARRSKQQLPHEDTAIYLGDTMGELKLLFAASDVAFVGGSFVPVGGHNLIEPASLSLPILTGKHLHNFIAVRDLLIDANALIIVENTEQFAEKVIQLFSDASSRDQYGARALGISEKNRGAINKTVAHIVKNL